MARDYKHQLNRKRKSKGVPGPVWLLGGLAAGLLVAYGPALLQHGVHSVGHWWSHRQAQTAEVPVGKPQASEEKPAPSRPRFEFYTILPEMEVVVPERELPSEREGDKDAPPPPTYVLQAGSFRHYEQADRLKAQLILMGLDVDVQTVSNNDNDTWHRVRVGPFDSLRKTDIIRRRLQAKGINSLVLKHVE